MTPRSGSLVDRAVARIWLYVKDGQIEERKFDRALRTVPGATPEREAVIARLRQFGVAVEATSLVSDEPTPAEHVEFNAEQHASEAIDQSVSGATAIKNAATAVDAAHAVLRYDRRNGPRPTRLLSALEEVGLVTLLRDGRDPIEQLENGYRRTLTPGSIPARAFDSMVVHNIRLVHKIAGTHLARVSQSGTVLELGDLTQAGMIGLIRAIEMFDVSRGLKFSTYATNWIRQSIGREIDNTSRLIRIPVHLMDEFRSIWVAIERLQSSGRSVNHDSIAELAHLPTQKVTHYLEYMRTPASLDLIVGDAESTALYTFIPADEEASPEFAFLAWSDAAELEEALSILDRRSAQILRMRAGFGVDKPKTLDEIGVMFGVTRERIRQLEAKALKQLRQSPAAADLRRMVGNFHVVAEESGFSASPRSF